jgi:phosphate transport system substrate-binding protein
MNAHWPKSRGYYTVLTNQSGADSWPITGASFALMHGTVKDGPAAGEALRFFDWAYNRGTVVAAKSDFAPLSVTLIAAVQHTWRTSIRKANQPLWLVK